MQYVWLSDIDDNHPCYNNFLFFYVVLTNVTGARTTNKDLSLCRHIMIKSHKLIPKLCVCNSTEYLEYMSIFQRIIIKYNLVCGECL